MPIRLLLPFGVVLFLLAVWAFAGTSANKPFEEAGEMICFRQIGHELLLSPGDSTYIINVIETGSHDVVCGFTFSEQAKEGIPCVG